MYAYTILHVMLSQLLNQHEQLSTILANNANSLNESVINVKDIRFNSNPVL